MNCASGVLACNPNEPLNVRVFIIRCDRPRGSEETTMWLKSTSVVVRWGSRSDAMMFAGRREAASIIKTINAPGALTLEEVEPT